MPTPRFRKLLLDRLVKGAQGAGELALALLMTAGVVHCGGATQVGAADGAADGRAADDGGSQIEAAEAAWYDAAVEAAEAAWYDATPIVEAPPPVQDGGLMVEAPVPADAGLDAQGPRDAGPDSHLMIEAPVPAPDAG